LAGAYQVDAGNDVYTVVDAATTYFWAVITGVATDEIFGTLNAPGFAVEVLGRTDLGTKALPNGNYAITGYPSQAFPPAALPVKVNYVLSAPGYQDLQLFVTIPTSPVFPVSPPPLPLAAMRLLPLRLQGCVVNSTTGSPVAGATVLSVDDPSSPPSAHTNALRAPLSLAHLAGKPVQAATIAPVGGALVLSPAVTGGDQVLNLNSPTGLAVNAVVQLASGGGVRQEYGIVSSLAPGVLPGTQQVFLTAPLNYSYAVAGSTVNAVSVTLTGTSATLTSDADVGDGVVLASQLFTQFVVLESGAPPEEIRAVGALTGTDGYYSLDGIGRVKQIFLEANSIAPPLDWFLEYDQPLNIVDFSV
jgi:hypothetical protein